MMKTLLPSALVVSVLVLAGCGGGDKKPASSDAASASAPAAAPAAAPATKPKSEPITEENGVKVVHLTGDDTMHYNITTIEAKPGESIKVEITNIGKMPAQAMSHNFVLLHPMSDQEVNAFGISASMAAPTYLPKDESKIIAHTGKMVGPGQTSTAEFKAPTEPGEYPYICTFPGHFATMRGKLIVK